MRKIYSIISGTALYPTKPSGKNSSDNTSSLKRRGIFLALTILLFLSSGLVAMAETYYSQGSVTVNVVTNWNTSGGASPANFNGTHTWIIQSGHSMTMSADWTVGEGGIATVIIEGGLTISSGYIVTVTGTLTVNGLLKNAGTYATGSPVTASGVITVNGEYEHARDGGTIPTAVWDVFSNCNVTGITITAPIIPSATQPFGNFIWNCPLQDPDQNIYLGGQLTAINGNLYINNTNGSLSSLKLGDSMPGNDLTVNGDFVQTGGRLHIAFASARKMTVNGNFYLEYGVFYITGNAGTGILDIGGNFYINGGYFNFINYTLAQGTLNVQGNCSITGGEFRMSKSSGTGIFNLTGNFTHTGGIIWEESTGSGSIVFNGTGTQIYTSGGSIPNTVVIPDPNPLGLDPINKINFIVNDQATLQMAAENTQLTGSGSFTLSAGGTLGIRSAHGITATGTVTNPGHIAVTGTRTYNSGGSYIYNGTIAQVTGSGLPEDAITGDILIADGASVTATNSIIENGTLTVNGTLIPGAADQVISGTGTLTGTGTVDVNRTAATADFLSQYTIAGKILTDLTVDYTASSGGQIVSPLTYGNLAMSNSSGTNTSGGNAIVGGTLTTAPGGTWDIGTNQLTINNMIHSGAISINSTAPDVNGSLIVTGTLTQETGTVTYNRSLPVDALSHYISSPLGSLTTTISDGVRSWNEVSGLFETASITSASPSGVGYAVNTTASSLAFSGSVVNSAGPITATSPYSDCDFTGGEFDDYSGRPYAAGRNSGALYGGGGWNLLGNPFTSAMIVSAFIDVNDGEPGVASDGSFDPNYEAVYIYDGTSYSYKGYEIPGYSNAGEDVFGYDNLQVGQGFFVLSHCNTSTFSFTPAMRTHSITVPYTKSAAADDPWPGLRLKVIYGESERSTLVVYNENMTAGLDPGYDLGQMSGGSEVEIYTTLAAKDNGVNFARQALPVTAAETTIVPVGVDTEIGGGVTFSAFTVPLGSNKFWLEDRVTGSFTDLTANTYTVTLPANTFGTGRFFIIASVNTPTAIENPQAEDTGIRIWTSHDKIIIKGEVSDRAICEVYDLSGQKIVEIGLTDSELNTVTMPSGEKGVYLVRVTDGKKVTSSKVVIL